MKPTREYQAQVRDSFNEKWSRNYRRLDEQAKDEAFEHYGALLRQLSTAFGRQIDALDVGCGTGRYFHYLRNVRRLVGLDLSPHMLEQARTPTFASALQVDSIELVCGEVTSVSFPDASFDLIYSVGVIGEYSPIDQAHLKVFLRLLKPGGTLFVTVVDTLSRVSVPENDPPSIARRLTRKVFPFLPKWTRELLNSSLSPFYVSRLQVESLFSASGFSRFQVERYVHSSGWVGTHFDCVALK
jgi:ubiquinone/menaquinone biosynthesis C-methylase UbiE